MTPPVDSKIGVPYPPMMPSTAIKSESNRTAIAPAATVIRAIRAKAGIGIDQVIEAHRGEDAEIKRGNAAADQSLAEQVIERAQEPRPRHEQSHADEDRQRHPTCRGDPAFINRVSEEKSDAHDQDHHAHPQQPGAGDGVFQRIAGRPVFFTHGDPVPDLDRGSPWPRPRSGWAPAEAAGVGAETPREPVRGRAAHWRGAGALRRRARPRRVRIQRRQAGSPLQSVRPARSTAGSAGIAAVSTTGSSARRGGSSAEARAAGPWPAGCDPTAEVFDQPPALAKLPADFIAPAFKLPARLLLPAQHARLEHDHDDRAQNQHGDGQESQEARVP